MTKASITLEKADTATADLDRIESLLEANGLPHQDVRTKPDCFFLANADGECVGNTDRECVGIGGVEIYGSNGLLRSVVITESNRGQGYGVALCDALEEYAQSNEVETLYLLTTTATAFFRQCGYESVSRETVPPSIQQTDEFSDLCPSSATCLKKDLG